MNEYNEHNLPADFDDLSKHAPLLEKLRAKGDGFVVPEGYFAESTELSVVSGRLSVVSDKDAGFTVPENYFEELAERIIAIVNLSSLDNNFNPDNRQLTTDNSFAVPENYFEELAERIIAIVNLSSLDNNFNPDNRQLTTDNSFAVPENYFEELSERINAIVALNDVDNRQQTTDNSFIVPEGYFSDLDETLNTKLALDNLKQDEGFNIPEGYFENLSGKILSHVAVDELNQGSDAEVPSGYFDTLADRITARIAEEENIEPEKIVERGRIIVFAEVLKRYSRPLSIAASVTLLISVSIWFFNRGNDSQNDHIAKYVPVKQKFTPVIPSVQTPDFVVTPDNNNVAVIDHPKYKSNHKLNPVRDNIVKQVEKKDVMEQLDLLDENVVADFAINSNAGLKNKTDNSLDDQMIKYLNDNIDTDQLPVDNK